MAKFVNANHPFRSMNTTEKLLADIESALGKTIECSFLILVDHFRCLNPSKS